MPRNFILPSVSGKPAHNNRCGLLPWNVWKTMG